MQTSELLYLLEEAELIEVLSKDPTVIETKGLLFMVLEVNNMNYTKTSCPKAILLDSTYLVCRSAWRYYFYPTMFDGSCITYFKERINELEKLLIADEDIQAIRKDHSRQKKAIANKGKSDSSFREFGFFS